jgi:hypothetical protein
MRGGVRRLGLATLAPADVHTFFQSRAMVSAKSPSTEDAGSLSERLTGAERLAPLAVASTHNVQLPNALTFTEIVTLTRTVLKVEVVPPTR